MKLASAALLACPLLIGLQGAADATSVRPAPYPFRCDRTLIKSDRDCYYFTMREIYGDRGFVSPIYTYAPAGYADPRFLRFGRVYRIHHRW
jgi:hypothetical protein